MHSMATQAWVRELHLEALILHSLVSQQFTDMVKRKREAKTKREADLLKLLLFVDTFWVSELSLILCWKREIWVLSLGQEDPLEEEVATHSKFHGQRNLVGYSPWGRRGSVTTESLNTLSLFLSWGFYMLHLEKLSGLENRTPWKFCYINFDL